MSSKSQLKTKDMDITKNILNNFILIRKKSLAYKCTHVHVINYYKQIIKQIVSFKNKKNACYKNIKHSKCAIISSEISKQTTKTN